MIARYGLFIQWLPSPLALCNLMEERELAQELLRDHLTVAGALVDLQLRHLPDEVRARVFDAVRNRTGSVELRTRIDAAETELVLVPIDGTEPLWLARTTA